MVPGMKLTCPACGAVCSADAWQSDELAREALATIAALPAPLPKATLGYLALFRPGKNGLGWKKALRLAEEIRDLAALGYVSVQGRIDRDCPPRIWAQAMEMMVEQRSRLSIPMPNHNYLKKIAHDLAEQQDARQESAPRQIARRPAKERKASISPLQQWIQGLRDDKPDEEEMAEWQRKQLGE